MKKTFKASALKPGMLIVFKKKPRYSVITENTPYEVRKIRTIAHGIRKRSNIIMLFNPKSVRITDVSFSDFEFCDFEEVI
jgi:hypothetical protein